MPPFFPISPHFSLCGRGKVLAMENFGKAQTYSDPPSFSYATVSLTIYSHQGGKRWHRVIMIGLRLPLYPQNNGFLNCKHPFQMLLKIIFRGLVDLRMGNCCRWVKSDLATCAIFKATFNLGQ